MALTADKDGFLQGDPIKIDKVSFARALSVLQDIRSDTGAIRSALYRRVDQATRPQSAANSPVFSRRRGPAVLPQRDDKGRFIKAAEPIFQAAEAAAGTAAKAAAKEATRAAIAEGKTAATPKRNLPNRAPSGRFLSAAEKEAIANGTLDPADLDDAKPGTPKKPKNGNSNEGGEGIGIGTAAGDTLHGAGNAVEGLDPAVAAAKELHAIATPLLSPVLGLGKRVLGFDKDQNPVPWYRRIWNELREMNKRSEEEGHGGGLLGKLASIATGIITLPAKMLRLLVGAPMGLLRGGAGLIKGGGSLLGGIGKMLFGRTAGMSRWGKIGRTLKGGGLLAALFGGAEVWSTEHDSSLTREQKTRKNFGTVGETAGSLLGGALGSLLGPLGTIGGAALGGYIGKAVGDKLADVDWKSVGDRIVDAWSKTADTIKAGWDVVVKKWDTFTKGLSDLLGPVVDKVAKVAKPVVAAATSAVKKAADATQKYIQHTTGNVAEKTGEAVAAGKKVVEEGYEKGKQVAEKAWEYAKKKLGFLSAKYEGKVDSVSKDNNGSMAYGKYQFNSKAGGLAAFFKANPEYAKQFKGMDPESKAFQDKWRDLAKNDPQFEAAQDKAAKSMFYDANAVRAQKAGFKLDNRGVQEAVFSFGINHSPKGNQKIIDMAAATPGFANMSPEDQIKAYYAARKAYVGSAKIDGGQKVKDNLYRRYDAEAKDAVKVAASQPAAERAPVAAGMPSAAMPVAVPATAQPASPAAEKTQIFVTLDDVASPSIPPVPRSGVTPVTVTVPPAPPVTTPIGSNARTTPTVVQPPSEVGQNPHDRSIAQIATGGLGSYL